MTSPRAVLCLLVLGLLTCAARAGETFKDPVNHWSATIPDGWSAVDPAAVETVRQQMANGSMGRNVSVISVWMPDNVGEDGVPFIMIAWINQPMKGASWSDIEGAFDKKRMKEAAEKAAKEAGDDFKEISIQEPRIDKTRNCVLLDMGGVSSDVGALRATGAGMIARDGMVNVWLYAKPDDHANQAKHLDTFIDSFKMDAGFAYTPKAFKLPVPLIGAIVAAIVVSVLTFIKKNK